MDNIPLTRLPAPTPDDYEEIAAVTGRVFVAATPERFTYDLWDSWNIIREVKVSGVRGQVSGGALATNNYPLATDYVWGLDIDGTLQGVGGVGGLLAVIRSDCAATNLQLTTYNSISPPTTPTATSPSTSFIFISFLFNG